MDFIELGKKIYRVNNPREAHRLAIFVIRCLAHQTRMKRLEEFFLSDELLTKISESFPFLYEQPTRSFFYHNSTFGERADLLKDHLKFLKSKLKPEIFLGLYSDETQILWRHENLELQLRFEPGQRKEGLASLMLKIESTTLYQIMFWISKDRILKKDKSIALWIGALQGPNVEDSKELVKKITKECHGYRTKNLILHCIQEFARSLGIEKIYAVTNEGYYANNHIRLDRKLKTSFSDFWLEAGGNPTDDPRFFELPLIEHRKTMEEVPTRKRAVYRRRFEMLDALDESIAKSMEEIMI
ncbi:MAG: DUF535 domain-containing protein [Selenomonadaceae bacterium]|nr:DUF535 domain-containing protein [Selenomonadaceae bacterium]